MNVSLDHSHSCSLLPVAVVAPSDSEEMMSLQSELSRCDETKFGPNLISPSPHVSHFMRSINTLSAFNETPGVNY